jgi:hypothetical protein
MRGLIFKSAKERELNSMIPFVFNRQALKLGLTCDISPWPERGDRDDMCGLPIRIRSTKTRCGTSFLPQEKHEDEEILPTYVGLNHSLSFDRRICVKKQGWLALNASNAACGAHECGKDPHTTTPQDDGSAIRGCEWGSSD